VDLSEARGILRCVTQSTPGQRRPPMTSALSAAELQRWYWLKTELVGLARALGVSPGGGKQELTARLAAALDGRPAPTPLVRSPAAARQLEGPLTPETVIPRGQRCSQQLRCFFTDEIGPGFRFDGPMRRFIAGGEGRTLSEAVEHWRVTRSEPRGEIASQFELNRFLRNWHAANPNGRPTDALAAWRAYRSLPVDGRS
jgi:hypothetical protein